MGDDEIARPNPGSPEAVAQGCECAVMDNCRGAGIMGNGKRNGWWIDAACPMHGRAQETADER